MSLETSPVHELTCIQCPLGCRLRVELPPDSGGPADPASLRVTGNRCPKGPVWAREELTDPRRVLTTSVRVRGGVQELASLKSREPLLLASLPRVMEALRATSVEAPVEVGRELSLRVDGRAVVLVITRAVARFPEAPA